MSIELPKDTNVTVFVDGQDVTEVVRDAVDLSTGEGALDEMVSMLTGTILGTLTLEDDECLVCLCENGDGIIVAQSDWLHERDVMLESTAEENNFNLDWDKDLTVGLYRLRVRAWANGEDDAGISVVSCQPLWAAPTIEVTFPGDEWLDKKPGDLVMSSGETMSWLLEIRRTREWMVEETNDRDGSRHVLKIRWDGKWLPVAFTDLNDHVGRVLTGTSPCDKRPYLLADFWRDPIAYLVRTWYWGVRKDDSFIYLVDSESDG